MSTEAQKLAAEFDAAAAELLTAAADLQHEAGYLRRAYPEPEWSPETQQSYLDASHASRMMAVKRGYKHARRILGDEAAS